MSEGTQRDRILGMIRQRHPGYHPLVSIADLAHSTDSEKLRLDCHKTIAKYVEPELSSVEMRGENLGGSITIVTAGAAGGRDLIEEMSKKRQDMLRVVDGKTEPLAIEKKEEAA